MKRAFAFTNYLKMNLLLLTLLLLISPTFAQTALQRFVNHPALKHASVGIAVTDLETGRRIVSHNGEQSLTPASVLKLITTATAIEAFGENYRYKTDVALDAGDPSRILVIGSGDPTLGSEAFDD